MSTTADLARERLAQLRPLEIDLVDDSYRHIGHAGARGGGGHYKLRIVSEHFTGQSRLARHRTVFDALGPLMQREIHALSITALTPSEALQQPRGANATPD